MKRAFTLIELLVVIAIIALLIGILLPALGKARGTARNVVSQSNMRSLGASSANYASDDADKIFSFNPNVSAGQRDVMRALSRRTGRIVNGDNTTTGAGGDRAFVKLQAIMPHRRYQHIVLYDYLTAQLPEETSASPFDRNLAAWQEDPIYAQNNLVPYLGGYTAGMDNLDSWANADVLQLWPYASSYQVVPAAWNPNNDNARPSPRTWTPFAGTPHRFTSDETQWDKIGQQRYYKDVAFPSGKVHMFEEFDRLSNSDGIWFAYPEAKCNLLFFDSSVRNLASRESNPGWNPAQPNSAWMQRYFPLDTFPKFAGHKPFDRWYMKYRWTRQGLAGIDFGGKDIGVPNGLEMQEEPG